MLHAPVLQLNVDQMHEIDPRNVENLFGMWTVFSKCSSTIPDGKRLENLSWRVWARETLCCPPQPDKTIVPAIDIPRASKEDLPSLSNSLGSVNSDSCSLGSSHTSFENSALSKSRGKEQHLTPGTLEKIIKDIQKQEEDLEPLNPAIEAVVNGKMSPEKNRKQTQTQPESPVSDRSDQQSINYATESSCLSTMTTTTAATTISPERCNPHRDSDTSTSSDGLIRSGSVVHGFSPVSSLRSRGSSSLAHNLPILASKNAAKNAAPKKSTMFTLGGSSEDDESSFDTTMSHRKTMLEPRKSSLSRSFNKDLPHQKKITSFKEVVEQHNTETGGSEADDNAIASDDDESDVDDFEDDDDEDQWEDEQAEEEKPIHNPVFKRVDSAAHLPSRRSILTAGLTEGDRAKGLLSAASKSTSALRRLNRASSHEGPSMPGSPENNNEDDGMMMMRATGNSRPIQISPPTNATTYAVAHSPRTTRRYMLSTELTESLRKNLLWERQQKNTTVNAFLKREARSMANLPRAGQTAMASASAAAAQPQRPNFERDVTKHNSFNDYFNVTNEYHTKGW